VYKGKLKQRLVAGERNGICLLNCKIDRSSRDESRL